MKEIRRKFNIFCFKNRNKGIQNLMLYVALGSGLVALLSTIDPSNLLLRTLAFDRQAILSGQIWRLVTYPLCYSGGTLLLTAITLWCYYSIGRAIENVWGSLRFNIFYFTGIILMDLYCLVFGGNASSYYLNMSLFLAYATLYPQSQFLLFFIIPIRAWVFALLDLAVVFIGLLGNPFPYNLFPLVALANYFLFFGPDVANLLPMSWRVKIKRSRSAGPAPRAKPIPFRSDRTASGDPPYMHKCTVCGKTDRTNPEMEFRYCSRCSGYYCYCQDHISNHVHIQN